MTFYGADSLFPRYSRRAARTMGMVAIAGVAWALAACSPSGSAPSAGNYPTDAEISKALQAQFANDPSSGTARELVRTLGGDKGELRYRVQHVISSQGAYEARYDAVLHMGRPGAESLQALYTTMIPEAERSKLADTSLTSQEQWLKTQAEASQKTAPNQARALLHTLEVLSRCYRDAPAGADVVVMTGLAALLSPERGGGLFAEKLASPDTVVQCLPA